MKNKKVFLYYVSFYIIGNVIFNLIFSIVKTIIINYIGGHEILIENLSIAFKETFLIYTIIFIFLKQRPHCQATSHTYKNLHS